uniref:Uncharacterized protein n=1 Tax=Ditylenchus dipsaci TaxID=166011 RepID=A0A915E005_9BILA
MLSSHQKSNETSLNRKCRVTLLYKSRDFRADWWWDQPWPLSGKKKICAVVVEMSAEEITVQFGTGKRFPYRRYL